MLHISNGSCKGQMVSERSSFPLRQILGFCLTVCLCAATICLLENRNFGYKMSGKCNDCHFAFCSYPVIMAASHRIPSSSQLYPLLQVKKSKMLQKSKSHTLTIAEKCQVIEMSKKGLSQRKLAGRCNLGKTQIQSILKSTEDIILRA